VNETLSIFVFFALSLGFILGSVLFLFYSERKLSAFMQDRMGPMHTGKSGVLQPMADLLKLLRKETIIPSASHKFLFILAPFLVFAPVMAAFSLLPLWPSLHNPAENSAGIFLVLAVVSLEAIGILMAAWASRSRFPIIGAARAIAQMVSYEVPLGLCVLSMVWLAGSGNFTDFEAMQSASGKGGWFPSLQSYGGILSWNLVQYPVCILLMPIFFLSILAESNRAPFDIPEGESEIIGGFHTEYSGFLWAIFFLGEYAVMLLLSLTFSYLFLGGSNSLIPEISKFGILSEPSFFWLLLKCWMLGLLMIWIRWSLPRLRVDQLSNLAWKFLSPLALVVLALIIFLE